MTFVSVVAALAISVGGLVLVGWAVDIDALKSILPGWVSVKANTAVSFVLIGIALLFSARPPGLPCHVARLCGWLAGGIGLLTMAEYISGWNPGFDQWLFPELAGTVATSNPGRMAPDSALCFVLLAAGLETVRAVRQRSRMLIISLILGGIVMSLAAAAVTTYLTPSLGAFGWCGLTNMAVPTATVFVVLGVALIVLARQAGGLNWSLARGHTLLFTGSLMLVLLLGLHASRSALWQAETALRVRYAEQVIAAISNVLGEAIKAQSHTRGYVITGEDRYLQSEQAASVRCRAAMAELRALLLVPAQQARTVQIEAQINELLQWYPRVIAARRNGGAGIEQHAMVNHGEDLMDRLRASIEQMDNAEDQVLKERNRQAQRVAMFTQVFVSTITLAGLIIFLSVLVGLNQAEIRRCQALEALRASELRYWTFPLTRIPD